MKRRPITSVQFASLTTATDFRAKVPPGATAFRVQGFPTAAASIPSTLPHYRARLTPSPAAASPPGLPANSHIIAEFDFLEHPTLWDAWIPLSEEDSTQGRALLVHNGGNVLCTGAIQQGRVLFRFDGEE